MGKSKNLELLYNYIHIGIYNSIIGKYSEENI